MTNDVMPDQLAKGGARLAQLLNTIWPSAKPTPTAGITKPVPPGDKVTACSKINVCYCITAANRQAIAANVARVRLHIADQRANGEMIGYLSVPISTRGRRI